MFALLLVLALHAAVFQSAQAASCDISDLGCIAKDFKASLQVNQGSFESEYQQFAEMIAPVLLLAHGGDFEASLTFHPAPCMGFTWLQGLTCQDLLKSKQPRSICDSLC